MKILTQTEVNQVSGGQAFEFGLLETVGAYLVAISGAALGFGIAKTYLDAAILPAVGAQPWLYPFAGGLIGAYAGICLFNFSQISFIVEVTEDFE